MSKAGEIRRDELCVSYRGSGEVVVYSCLDESVTQKWIYIEVRNIYISTMMGIYTYILMMGMLTCALYIGKN